MAPLARHEPRDGGARRRAEVERQREAPQHGTKTLVEIVDGAAQQEVGVAAGKRPPQMTAGKGPVKDDRSAHPADMAHRSSSANPRPLERDDFSSSRHPALPLCLSM